VLGIICSYNLWVVNKTNYQSERRLSHPNTLQYVYLYRGTQFSRLFSPKIRGGLCKIWVFKAVTMKNAVFWDVVPCRSCVNRRLGGMYRLHLQGRKIGERGTSVSKWLQLADFCTLKMEAIRSFETSVHTRSTRRHIPEDGIFHR
jgi:hypothetical protein